VDREDPALGGEVCLVREDPAIGLGASAASRTARAEPRPSIPVGSNASRAASNTPRVCARSLRPPYFNASNHSAFAPLRYAPSAATRANPGPRVRQSGQRSPSASIDATAAAQRPQRAPGIPVSKRCSAQPSPSPESLASHNGHRAGHTASASAAAKNLGVDVVSMHARRTGAA